MTEIPEHLLAKAKAAREKAAAKKSPVATTRPSAEPPLAAEPEPEVVEPDEKAEAARGAHRAPRRRDRRIAHQAPSGPVDPRGAADWRRAFTVARDRLDCRFFDWLSAIDWMPSPYGREHETPNRTPTLGNAERRAAGPDELGLHRRRHPLPGHRPGCTRVTRHVGVIIKADVADDDPRIDSLDPGVRRRQLARARGLRDVRHRRSTGIPTCATSTCPATSRVTRCARTIPLLARALKPWPGIVDVEAMPGDDDATPAEDDA